MSDASGTTRSEPAEAETPQAHPGRRDRAAYEEVARALLERPLPPDYRAEWARHFAAEKPIDTGVEVELASAVIFRIGEEWLALSTAVFREAAEPRLVHSLPHRRNGIVRGIVNVRGELLVCISFATLLGIDKNADAERGDRSLHFERMVVIGRANGRIAFSVHEVHGIHRYESRALTPVPGTVGHARAFTKAMLPWQGRTVGLLDETRLLDAVDRNIA
jgi:chemotaxis-related protein WspD